jgi:hypothetical protein
MYVCVEHTYTAHAFVWSAHVWSTHTCVCMRTRTQVRGILCARTRVTFCVHPDECVCVCVCGGSKRGQGSRALSLSYSAKKTITEDVHGEWGRVRAVPGPQTGHRAESHESNCLHRLQSSSESPPHSSRKTARRAASTRSFLAGGTSARTSEPPLRHHSKQKGLPV